MSNDAEKIVDIKQAVGSTDSLEINKNEFVSTSSNVTYAAGKSPNDVIKKFMKYLDTTTSYGTTALDGAIEACSNFTGIQDAINHMISDCQTANSYTEFLTEKCGIVPDNEDTGAITGFDAGGSTVKDQYSIVPESGSKINYTGSSFTVDGLTVNLGLYDSSYQFTPATYNNLTSAQKSIWQSAYMWWVKGALDLNAESYGKNFGFSNYSSATTNTLNFGFQYGGSGTLAWTSFNIDAYGKNQALGMAVNMNYYDAIDQSDPNGSSSTAGATYLDRTLAHEFTHAVMVSNIDYYDKLPKFIREGMAELTHGIDDERGNRIINLAQNPSSLRSALDLSLTSGGDTNTYAGGYMFLRYLAQQGAVVTSVGKNIHNSTSNTLITGTAYSDEIYNTGSNVTISVGAGNDKISIGSDGDYSFVDAGAGNDSVFSNSASKLTIDGGAGNDTLTGIFYGSSIFGGDGNDLISIHGGANNKVLLGTGNDTVYSAISYGVLYGYEGGNSYISGAKSSDTISIVGGSVEGSTMNSGNYLLVSLKSGDGVLTLEGAANTGIKLVGLVQNEGVDKYNYTSKTFITGTGINDTIYNTGSNVTISVGGGEDTVYNAASYASILAGNGSDTVTSDGYGSTILAGGGDDFISIGSSGDYSRVEGNSGDDSIRNWYGTNVTIDAGDGNDTIFNYYGDNTTINANYGDDFIYNAASSVTIDGGNGDDTIRNERGYNSKMYAGNGNDLISIEGGMYSTIDGGAGDDTIAGYFWDSSINAGAGDDVISLNTGGYYNTVRAGTGNDTIISSISNVKFFYEGGNDLIRGWADNDTLSLTGGLTYEKSTVGSDVLLSVSNGDTITLEGAAYKTLNIYPEPAQGIYIYNWISNTILSGTTLNDVIYNSASYVTINAGAGEDSIYIYSNGDYTSINAGANEDSIYCADGEYMTIDGDVGNDIIAGTFYNSSINAGVGNDLISIGGGANNTVLNGTGNDTVVSEITSGLRYLYTGGNDLIRGWSDNDTLSLTGGLTYTQSTVGTNVLLNVSNGYTITLEGAAGKTIKIYPELETGAKNIYNSTASTLITGTAQNDTIRNTGKYVTISVGGGNDSISNTGMYASILAGEDVDTVMSSGRYSTIFAGAGNDIASLGNAGDYSFVDLGAGNDSIFVPDGDYVSISGGNDADTITGKFWSSSINGGAGNDFISIFGGGAKNTVDAGAGNDTIISALASGIFYNFTGGNDLIQGWTNRDSMSVSSSWERVTIGNDVLVSVEGVGVAILVGASGKTINVYPQDLCVEIDTSGVNIVNRTSSTLVVGKDYDDTIRNLATNVTISVGSGVDSIYNTDTYTSIIAGADNDTIINTGSYATIYAGEGNDIATVNGYRSLGVLGNGDDTVFTSSGNYMTISGDVGNDRIIGRFSYSSIDGGADNDFISIIGGSRNTVDAGEGDDTIISAITSGVFYNFTGGNDIIQGWTNRDSMSVAGAWERVTIGNDVLVSVEGVGVATLYGARGKTISVYPRELSAEKVGFDIYNTKSATLITGNAYGDTINNRGSRVTVSVGAGVDSIYNTGSYASILAGADGDSIINIGSYSTIDAGEGDDKVTISGSRLQIDLGTGNDEFFGRNNLTYATIDAGDGQDNITGRFYYSSIYGGADDDYISIGGGSRNTVDAGEGNDTIISAITGGVLYNFTGGNDLINGWTSRDSMSVAGAWERVTVGNDVLVSVEGVGVTTLEGAKGKTVSVYPKDLCVEIDTSGAYVNNSAADTLIVGKPYDDTIRNTGARVTVSVGAGADSIYNNGAQASIMAGDGNDTIYNYNSGDNSFVDGGAGNDTIFSPDGDNVTISGGDGNDTITGKFWTASISGGADNDLISIGGGSKNTINTGAGNDTIISSIKKGFFFQYEGGDDYVSGWSSNDSISLPSSVTYAQSTVGSDVQISLSSGDVVTLAGASGKTINIFPEKVSTPTITAQQFIKDFMKSLDTTDKSGVAALNEAISVASGGYYADMQTARNKMVADCQSVGSANTFLVDKCGIDLYNTDTGAITGYDAGGSTSPKTASSVIPESGSLDTSFTGNYFAANGLNFYLTDMNSNYTLTWKNYSDLTTDAERFVWRALKTWWGKGALDINAESYGNNFGFDTTSSATTKNMYFAFVNEPSSGALATTWNWSSGGQVTQLAMTVNMNYYSGIDTADPNGSSSTAGSISLDRVLAHEFTHAVMAANINYFNDLPQFIKEGMAELTHGIDDARGSNILNLAGNSSSLYNALDVTNVQTGTVEAYAGGFMFLRYIAKQVAENYSANNNFSKPSGSQNLFSVITSEIEINGDTLTANPNFSGKTIDLAQYSPNIRTVDASALNKGVNITGNTYANEILGGTAADTISGNTGGDTIHGGAGNDIIFGDAGDDNIFGDAGIDTLSGGSGNNTLTGGDGADTFVHTTGNDFITDYTERQDKIQLVDGEIIGSSISGADVVLKFMTSSVTVKGGKDKDITVIDSDGVETTQKYFDSTTDTLWFDGGNNFITDDAQIDSITELSETNYSIENIFATQNYSALTTNETLVTAAEYLKQKQS